VFERAQRRRERPTARADHLDLVDHERREIERLVSGHGALQDQRAAWPRERDRAPEAGDGAGGDHQRRPLACERLRARRRDAAPSEHGELGVVMAERRHLRARGVQHLRDEQAELSVTQQDAANAGRDRDLRGTRDRRGSSSTKPRARPAACRAQCRFSIGTATSSRSRRLRRRCHPRRVGGPLEILRAGVAAPARSCLAHHAPAPLRRPRRRVPRTRGRAAAETR
jgi:hypothetical protein